MSRFRSASRLLEPLGFFVLAFALRALPFPLLFGRGQGAFFFGNDAYYHARRVLYSVVHFPAVLGRDPYMNFPYGGEAIWPPTLDWLAAGLVRLLVGPGDPVAMERILAWIPPVLGALTVAGLYLLARWAFSRGVAVVSALVLAFMPAHFWYSQVGFFDHHVATALVTLVLLSAAMATLACSPVSRDRVSRWCVAWLGLALAGVVLVWPGCLLHVVIVEAALLVRVLSSASQPVAVAWSGRFAAANAIALAAVAPFSLGHTWSQWGRFSPLVLSDFQPLFFALATLCFGVLALGWRRVSMPRSPWGRAGQAAVLGLVVGCLALLFVPGLLAGLVPGWEWLFKGESFQAEVQESSALLSEGMARPDKFLTRLFYLTPLFLVALALEVRNRENPAPHFLFLGWTTALAVVTLVQFRFVNSFSVAFSLLVGASLVLWLYDLVVRGVPRRAARVLVLGVFAAIVFFAIQPGFAAYAPHLENLRDFASGERSRPSYLLRLQVVREDLAFWLRANSPETSGWLDADATPEYAVLAPWSIGHVLKYRARRPVLHDNFGDDVAPENFDRVRAFYAATDEAAALELLDNIPVRYVVVRDPERIRIEPEEALQMENRLYRYQGSGKWVVDRQSGEAPLHVPALSRHRLVFESVPLLGKPGEEKPVYRVFEIVPGAELVGRAEPGEAIVVSLPVKLARGGGFTYQVRTRADASGDWSLVVPYATAHPGAATGQARPYTVTSSSGRVRVGVPEQAVQSGGRVEVPPLRSKAR